MTIGRNITSMTPQELTDFVSLRQRSRSTHEWKVGKKVKTLSVAKIAKLLGVSKSKVLEEMKKQLKEVI